MIKITNGLKADIIGYLGIIFSAFAQIILSPAVKYCIGISGLGAWHLLFQTFNYLRIFDSGLGTAIVRFVAENNTDKNKNSLYDIYATSKISLSVVGTFFMITGLVSCFLIPYFIDLPIHLSSDFFISLFILSVWGFFRYRYFLPILNLRGLNRIVAFNWLSLLEGGGRPLLGALLIILKPTLICLISGYIIIELASRIIAYQITKTTYSAGKFTLIIFKNIITYGGSAAIISISSLLVFYSSSFIVGHVLGVDAIATFQSTIALPYLIARFAFIPFRNKAPGYIKIYQTSLKESLRTKALLSHLNLLLCITALLIMICFVNKIFVRLWLGEELYAGNLFTIVYSSFILMTVARHNGYIMWQVKGNLKLLMISHIIEVPINIFLSFIFLRSFGLAGVVYAMLIAHSLPTIISQLHFFHTYKVSNKTS